MRQLSVEGSVGAHDARQGEKHRQRRKGNGARRSGTAQPLRGRHSATARSVSTQGVVVAAIWARARFMLGTADTDSSLVIPAVAGRVPHVDERDVAMATSRTVFTLTLNT